LIKFEQTMKIQLRFFASIREKLAISGEVLELDDTPHMASEVRALLMARGDVWAEVLAPGRALRMAYNQQMITSDTILHDGGELAFFPPVTGG
jgi:molybdopterin synthase sulfur carrier subunit